MAHVPKVFADCARRFKCAPCAFSLQPIKESDKPFQFETMSKPPWFDLWNINAGFQSEHGDVLCPTIWIDTDRGVFYYSLFG
jgi:hypothetical protein